VSNYEYATQHEIIQKDSFKDELIKLINNSTKKIYFKPSKIPMLYKYGSIKPYILDNIENGQISLSLVTSFNDYFDTTIHTEVSDTAGKDETDKMVLMAKNIGIDDMLGGNSNQLAESLQKAYERNQRTTFSSAEYYGIHVCSFSTNPKSTLMWSHYADNNQGICIGYNYKNLLRDERLLKSMLYPVAYIDQPIDATKYLDVQERVCEFPVDVAIFASILSKATCWSYEKEWRFVSVGDDRKSKYIQYNNIIKPSLIILGYHWIKPFFSDYNFNEKTSNIKRLLKISVEEKIPIFMTLPHIGHYSQNLYRIDVNRVLDFIKQQFDNYPTSLEYYTVVHDDLCRMMKDKGEKV